MSDKRNVIREIYSTNENLEKDGVWFDIAPTGDDGSDMCRIRLARMGGQNKRFEKLNELKFKKYRAANKTVNVEKIPERIRIPIMREICAETVVTEWEHVYDDDGEALPLSIENVIQVFKDNPDLFLDCLLFAVDRSNYQDSIEEDVKN